MRTLALVTLALTCCGCFGPWARGDIPAPSKPSPRRPAPVPTERDTTLTQQGWQSRPSGLKYKVVRPGSGRRPTVTDRVRVHYRGTLLNGKVFDSSYARGQPITFGLGQVIKGWTEGLQLMREGARYELEIPSHLAYGERGAPPSIGPNETLHFTVDLIGIE